MTVMFSPATLFAEHAGEEGGVAVDGVAVGGVEDVADDGAGDLGREDDGGLLRGDAAGAEAAEGAAGGFVADGFGVFESGGGAGVRVPVVALHVAVCRPGRWAEAEKPQ